MALSFTMSPIKKEENMTRYSIYKNNHPVISKQVINVVDLVYIGVEKDYPVEQLSAIPDKKRNT